jgi:hypothetical protein
MQIRMRWSFLFVVRRRNVPVSTGLPRGATPDPRNPAASSVINKREKSVRRQVAYGKMLNLALMSSLEVFLPTARLRMKFERTEAGTRSPRILSRLPGKAVWQFGQKAIWKLEKHHGTSR